MIIWVKSRLHRPERGWDPITPHHARWWLDKLRLSDVEEEVDMVVKTVGEVAGRRMLDLGAGPGVFSVAFARRGAHVTWHDVSATYLAIARHLAAEANVGIEYSLGYLEDARKFVDDPFDLVFCRQCWNYCMDDWNFARLIYSLLKPGGAAYCITGTANWVLAKDRSFRTRFLYALYQIVGVKAGYLFPPHGRIAELFNRLPVTRLCCDYSERWGDAIPFSVDRVFLFKGNEDLMAIDGS